MKVRVPDYYNSFCCLGSNCPDTCCVGWQIEIDEASYERFKALKGNLGKKIMDNITFNDEKKPVFKLSSSGRCAFLNENNLCQMYIDLGSDSLCSLCDNYPRIGEEFGSLRELGLSVSCPEVARIILNHDAPIEYEEWEFDEVLTDIDYVGDDTFELMLLLRETAIFIAQNKDFDIFDRMKLYIVLASHMQAAMDDNNFEALADIAENFSQNEYLFKITSSFGQNSSVSMDEIYKFMEKLDYISKDFVDILNSAAANSHRNDNHTINTNGNTFSSQQLENILVYLILRYFMKSVFDGDIYAKAVFSWFFITTIKDIAQNVTASPTTIVYLFSKEIEHCEENMEMLYDLFWQEPFINPINLL